MAKKKSNVGKDDTFEDFEINVLDPLEEMGIGNPAAATPAQEPAPRETPAKQTTPEPGKATSEPAAEDDEAGDDLPDDSKDDISAIKEMIDLVGNEPWFKQTTTISIVPAVREELELIEKYYGLSAKALVTGIMMKFLKDNKKELQRIKKEQDRLRVKWL